MTNAEAATEGIAIMMAVANYVLCSVAEMRAIAQLGVSDLSQLSTALVYVKIPSETTVLQGPAV